MDSFETVVAAILQRKGYWTQTSVKVDLTKAEKVEAIGDAAELGWPLGLRISPFLMTPEEFAQLAELEARLALDILNEGISM